MNVRAHNPPYVLPYAMVTPTAKQRKRLAAELRCTCHDEGHVWWVPKWVQKSVELAVRRTGFTVLQFMTDEKARLQLPQRTRIELDRVLAEQTSLRLYRGRLTSPYYSGCPDHPRGFPVERSAP